MHAWLLVVVVVVVAGAVVLGSIRSIRLMVYQKNLARGYLQLDIPIGGRKGSNE